MDKEYFDNLKLQLDQGDLIYGGITSTDELNQNLEVNCIPLSIKESVFEDYEQFLKTRRILMTQKIKAYYLGL